MVEKFTVHRAVVFFFLISLERTPASFMPEIKSTGKPRRGAERNDYISGDVYEDHETALNEHVGMMHCRVSHAAL